MSADLHLAVNGRYAWLLTIFYITYILFQFQILAWKRFPPHRWCAFVILGWGVVSACQAATNSWGGEMALRFLLGVFEGTVKDKLLLDLSNPHKLDSAPVSRTCSASFTYDMKLDSEVASFSLQHLSQLASQAHSLTALLLVTLRSLIGDYCSWSRVFRPFAWHP